MHRRTSVVILIALISNVEKKLYLAHGQRSASNRNYAGVGDIVTSKGNVYFQKTVLLDEIDSTKGKREIRTHTFSPSEDDYTINDDYAIAGLWDKYTEDEGYLPISKAPWQVAMFKDNNFHCSGTLLTNLHFITAAHCIAIRRKANRHMLQPTYEYWLRLGSFDYSSGGRIFYIKSFNVHPSFLSEGDIELYKDLAVITLKEKVPFSHSIGPAVIHPKLTSDDIKSWVGKTCLHAGWSLDNKDLSINVSLPLKMVRLPIVPDCRGRMVADFQNRDPDVHICTGNVRWKEFSCLADSGSGLFYNNKLVGISSWGIGCAEGLDTIFARVDNERAFIDNIINKSCQPNLLPLASLFTLLFSMINVYLS